MIARCFGLGRCVSFDYFFSPLIFWNTSIMRGMIESVVGVVNRNGQPRRWRAHAADPGVVSRSVTCIHRDGMI